MFFKFVESTPKGRLKEFGTFDWAKRNKLQLIVQSVLLMSFAFVSGFPFMYIWAFMPLLAVFTFMVGKSVFIGSAIQSFWYLPVLFWDARKEVI